MSELAPQLSQADQLTNLEPELGGNRSLRLPEHASGLGMPLASWVEIMMRRLWESGDRVPIYREGRIDMGEFEGEFGEWLLVAIEELERFPLMDVRLAGVFYRLVPMSKGVLQQRFLGGASSSEIIDRSFVRVEREEEDRVLKVIWATRYDGRVIRGVETLIMDGVGGVELVARSNGIATVNLIGVDLEVARLEKVNEEWQFVPRLGGWD